MTTISGNSTSNFGISKYILSTDPASSTSTDLQVLFDYVVSQGGDTIYIQPGVYTLNGVFNTGGLSMTIVGASSDTVDESSVIPLSTVVINGNQTVTGTGSITFQNMSFTATSGTTFSATSSGTSSLAFTNCSILNTGGAGLTFTGASLASFLSFDKSNVFASTTAVSISNCAGSFTSSGFYGGTGAALSIGANCQITGITNQYTSTSSYALVISSATGELVSSGSVFTALTAGVSTVNFTAAGILVTVNDQFLSNAASGYYATTTNGSLGVIRVGNATIQGSASLINPTLLPLYYPSSTTASINSLTWGAITSNQTLQIQHGYIVSSGALSLALPTSAPIGSEIQVMLSNLATSWVITQAAGQRIVVGSAASTVGVGGSIASSATGDAVDLICIVANTTWMSRSTQGNIIIV